MNTKEELHGGPLDGAIIELHPLNNQWQVIVEGYIYRRSIFGVFDAPNPLVYSSPKSSDK